MSENIIVFLKLLSAITLGMILSIFFTKQILNINKKKNNVQIEREYLQNHINKKGTPTMGGIAFVFSTLITFLIINFNDVINYKIYAILLGFLGFFIIGFIDDYLKVKIKTYDGLKASIRILLEILISVYIIIIFKNGGFNLNTLFVPVINGLLNNYYWFFPFIIIVIVGSANAINLSDGLDGLASGLTMIALTPFMLISINSGEYQISLLIASLIGSLIGFLVYNFYPAKIFMGDCGSLSLGAAIATISISLHSEIILLIAGILFVLEAISVILQVGYFKLTHKRIFLMAPLHHHYEKKGWEETKVIMLFYLIGSFAALLSIIIEVI